VTALDPARRDVAFVFQQYSLYPHYSVFDNLAFPLRAPGRKSSPEAIRKRVHEVAEMLRIASKLDNRATQLSGGEMQRVALGRALVREPDLFGAPAGRAFRRPHRDGQRCLQGGDPLLGPHHPAGPDHQLAAQALRKADRPLLVAGGGVHYALATEELAAFAEQHRVPVVETIAGRACLPHDHPNNAGPLGVIGSASANALAADADVVLAVGTRLQDFTTGSWTGSGGCSCTC
jgi:hypothetical protein